MMRNTRRATGRRGYTLMEMLLVQGVIVALVAMSWPALRGSLDKNRLLSAARQVRTDMIQARLKAAETGVAQQFRYKTGDRRYEVTAAQPTGTRTGSSNKSQSLASATAQANGLDDEDEADTRLAMLDEEVSFADSAASKRDEKDVTKSDDRQSETKLSDSLGEESWSAPVVFQPNGRSNNARVRLIGPRGFHVDVSLRGLTGAVTVGELTRDDELASAEETE